MLMGELIQSLAGIAGPHHLHLPVRQLFEAVAGQNVIVFIIFDEQDPNPGELTGHCVLFRSRGSSTNSTQ